VLSLASSIIVARLLTPEEIGLFSVSLSLIAFGHVFRDFGIGQYLVQAENVSRDHLRAANTMMIMISWSIALLFFVIRHVASNFYQNEGIAEILTLLACNFVILPFGAPLLSMLRREMKFDRIALVSISANITQLLTIIVLAQKGFSYMSMAWGSLVGTITTTAMLIAMRPTDALLMPRLAGMREIFRFGAKSSIASLAGQAGSAAPDLIIGRALGFAEVALYSRAWGMMSLVIVDFTNIVRGVFFPAFARSVREGANPLSTYLRASAQLTGFTIPMLALLALVADPLIHLLFGSQWVRSAPLATIICLYAMLVAPFSLAGVAMVACGRVGIFMRAQLLIQGARILVILTSFFLDLELVVLLLGLAYYVEANVYVYALKKAIGLTLSIFLRSIWRSYALASITIITPAFFVLALFSTGTKIGGILLVTATGGLALLFWLVGIHSLHHPLMPEIERIRSKYFLANRSK
jgi:O-antigen/teichoic acid export membrane protein